MTDTNHQDYPSQHLLNSNILCYIPDTNRIVVTRHPVFDEECFPFASEEAQDLFSHDEDVIMNEDESQAEPQKPMVHDFDMEMMDQLRSAQEVPEEPPVMDPDKERSNDEDEPEAGDDLAPDDYVDGPVHTKYGRTVRPPQPFWIASPAALAISLSAVESVIKAKKIFEPKTYKEAITCEDSDEWKESIQTEVNTLLANDTFRIISASEVPSGRRVVKSKWVFKVKCDNQGNFLSRKTRLVAKGFTEVPGVDFFEIFHPVGKGITFRLLCAKAVCKDYTLYHVDIKGAFLHATLQEEIYMQLPPGTGLEESGKPCTVRLKKSLYGLKQAGRDWYCAHSDALMEMGFKRSVVDPCLFHHEHHHLWLHMYVDDDLIAARSRSDFDWFVEEFSKHFSVGSATIAQHYLGIRVQQGKGLVKLDQQASIEDLLVKYNMENAKGVNTPAAPGVYLDKIKENEEATKEPYRSLVGALLYLGMHTRPDIAYAVNELTRHCEQPTDAHWTAAKRVLRYLKDSKEKGLEFRKEKGMILVAAADSDWAGGWKDKDNEAKSTSGYVISIAGSVLVAKTKRQTTTALSSCEAEYVSLALAAQEIVHCRQILCDLQEEQSNATRLICDNVAACELTKSETHQQRSKHIAIRYHFIRECVKRGEIQVQWLSGDKNPADMFTKPLGPALFKRHLNELLG